MADVGFTVPSVIKDFLFDLQEATRRSLRIEDVQRLYETTLKEVTDKYFNQSPWPDSKTVAAEVDNDESFLLFYREMTIRHISTKLKPQLADHITSWNNYLQLFEFVLNAKTEDLCITTKWIYDITQEFAYQFQGFCQFRCQVGHHSVDTLKVLEANRGIWTLPTVISLLNRLIRKSKEMQKELNITTVKTDSPFQIQFGYFATIELARLQCLLGDYNASLKALGSINLQDRSELFMNLTVCHFNVFYHNGVSHMMVRRFSDALDIFTEIILHLSRILKPGATQRHGLAGQLQRMLDKVLALTAIVITVLSNNKVDDQVNELVEAKYADKLRRLRAGEKPAFVELFEFASPKFISPVVPNYSVPQNINQDAFNHRVAVFIAEIQQHIEFLKLRSYLGLYASIDLSKLARFNDISETELCAQLSSFKHKSLQYRGLGRNNINNSNSVALTRVNATDVHIFIDQGVLYIDSADNKESSFKKNERYFVTGIRKHANILDQLNGTFKSLGLK